MINAIVYILVILALYIVIDVLLFVVAGGWPAAFMKEIDAATGAADAEAAKSAGDAVLEKLKSWKEKEYKLEYKTVFVASKIGKRILKLKAKWQSTWPDDYNAQMSELGEEFVESVPKYVETFTRAIVVAVVLALIIRTFVIQAFKIPSGSMIPTLLVGDQLIVSKFSYGIKLPFTSEYAIRFRNPKHGDIVVFKPPLSVNSSWADHEIKIPLSGKVIYQWRSQVDFIKRIVGLPGDKVELKDGALYINDLAMKLEPAGTFEYDKYGSAYVRESHKFIETIDGKSHVLIYDDAEPVNEDWGPYNVKDGEFFVIGDNRDDSQDSRSWGGQMAHIEDIRGKALFIHFSWDYNTNRPRLARIGTILR